MSEVSYIHDGKMQGTIVTTKINDEVNLGVVIEENLKLRDCLHALAKAIAAGQWADPNLQIEMLTTIKHGLRAV